MSLQLFLLLAAGLFAVGLYGALSQQSIVMIMMGLELMLNGVIVAAAAFWHYVAPAAEDGQVIVVVAVVAMAVEMAAGFAAATAIFRARDVDMADEAADLVQQPRQHNVLLLSLISTRETSARGRTWRTG